MQVVPERIIKESAEVMAREEPNNTFAQVLELGEQFKSNGLSPIYLLDTRDMTIHVTSKQRVQKKLN